MSKDTFKNLKKDKKEKIISVLKETFKSKSFYEVTVKEIVEKLDIPRGSFYQYFEDLEDAYFEILDREILDIHGLFMKIFIKEEGDLKKALEQYGKEISSILFDKDSYLLYKNSYVYLDESMRSKWEEKHDFHKKIFADKNLKYNLDKEKMHFIKGVIHSLVMRNYKEEWDKEKFLNNYKNYCNRIIDGISI